MVSWAISTFLRTLLAEVFVAATAYLAWACVERMRPLPRSILWLAWITMMLFWITIGFHLLLITGFYNVPGTLVWSALCLAAAWRFQADRRSTPAAILSQPILWWRWMQRSIACEKVYLLMLPPLVVQLLIVLVRPCLGFDYCCYHGLKAALWVQQGLHYHFDSPSGWTVYRCFPAGGSIALSWAMLLFHSDRFSTIVSVATWPFFILAAYALARELLVPSRWAWLLAWFCGTIPNVLFFSGDGNIDIPMHGLLMTAYALVLRGFRTRSTRYFWLQAVAAGLAATMKLTTLPCAFIVVLSPLILFRQVPIITLIKSVACGLAVVVGLMLPWYYYDYLLTGFPLSPLSVQLGGVTLGVSPPAVHMYLNLPLPSGSFPGRDLKALALIFFSKNLASSGPYILVLLLLSPFGLYHLLQRSWHSALFVLLILAYNVALYFSHSFQTNRFIYATLDGRFFLSLLMLYAIIGYPRSSHFRALVNPFLFLVVLYDLLYAAFEYYKPERAAYEPVFGFIPVFFGLMTLLTYRVYQWKVVRANLLVGTFLFALPVWIMALTIFGDLCRPGFVRPYFRWFDHMGPAIVYVDQPPASYRIALTTETYPNYNQIIALPFLGRELQNEVTYVPISRSGKIYDDTDPHRLDEADFDAWKNRLIAQKIDAVMTFSPRSIEMDWMEAHPALFQSIVAYTLPLEGPPQWSLTSIPSKAVSGWGLYRVIPVSRIPDPLVTGN